MKHEKANNISPSLGQDGPLPDLTKTAGDLMNPTPTSIFRSNGSSMPNSNVLNKNNGDEYSRNTDVIVPEPKNFLSSSSVMTAPMGGKEKSVSSPFSPNFFPSNANSHSLILNKGAPTTFGPGSSSTSSIFQTGNTSMTSSAVPKVGQLLSGSVMDILSGNKFPTTIKPLSYKNTLIPILLRSTIHLIFFRNFNSTSKKHPDKSE